MILHVFGTNGRIHTDPAGTGTAGARTSGVRPPSDCIPPGGTYSQRWHFAVGPLSGVREAVLLSRRIWNLSVESGRRSSGGSHWTSHPWFWYRKRPAARWEAGAIGEVCLPGDPGKAIRCVDRRTYQDEKNTHFSKRTEFGRVLSSVDFLRFIWGNVWIDPSMENYFLKTPVALTCFF